MNLNLMGLKSIWQPSLQSSHGGNLGEGHLLVVLHGRGDSAEGFEWLLPALGLPGLNALLLNAPDEYYTGYSWYGLPPDQLPGILRSRALLENVFAEIEKQGFPPERCLLLGFSQGCLMTLEFGGRYSKRLAGYVGISGYCYDPQSLIREAAPGVPQADWLITHGSRDDLLPIDRTRMQVRELIAAGFKIDYREYPKTHTIDEAAEFPQLREWIRARLGCTP